ncbi:Crp/Fnr family transcriptional regulator [Phocaeicola paurosaccharolyticus]|jgi:CRP-like cAMP-binding protein|uniref:Crp/Fnr family transcriptional regulator n=1 Tax=Phocaeicola paurosaccharolyticus TaxID=732242 RepID=UPI0005502EF5|nr:Crp/Fnr family transcriptional regulator [Phocaeicola paurosaccharolyticus]
MIKRSTIETARTLSSLYYALSKESLLTLSDILVYKKCRKGERLIDEGDVCKNLIFIEKGLVRQFYYKNGKELTEHISYENGIVMNIESLFQQEPSRLMIETLEASNIWLIPLNDLERISDSFVDIQRLYRTILKSSLIESQIKADILRFEPANVRYLKLMEYHPEILKRTPLVYVASLLQMTPETLSRVRSSLL